MKRILATAALALLTAPTAFAADTRLELPLRELINSPQARAAGIDGSVRFYLAGEKTPAVAARMGEDVTNKKTNGVGKSDVESCNWVALSALKALQEGAKDRGANAVIDMRPPSGGRMRFSRRRSPRAAGAGRCRPPRRN